VKHWSLYISHTLMALLIIALASCSDTDYLGAPSEGDATEVYVSVMLNVNGGSTDTRTRATITPDGVGDDNTPDISMQDGLDYEENIDPNDIDLLLFTRGTADNGGDGTFVARVNLWHYWTSQGDLTNEPDRSYQYQIMGYVENSAITLGNEYQLMAICNMGVKKDNGHLYTTISDGETIYNSDYNEENLKGKTRDEVIRMLTFRNYQANFTQALTEGKARIPMWGIKSVTLKKEGNNFGMDVLRAMAKVRVKLSDALIDAGYKLNYLGMNANNGGYVATQQTAVMKLDDGTLTTQYNSDTHTGFTFPSVLNQTDDESTDKLWVGFVPESDNSNSHIAYVPEYQNIGKYYQSVIQLQIFKNGKEIKFNDQSPVIYFADYSNDGSLPTSNEWDILRNDFYDFTITGIAATSGLEANVRVMPWEYETMEYELSQNAEIQINWTSAATSVNYGFGNALPVAYDNTLDYVEHFLRVNVQMNQPVGVKWVAHLTNTVDFELLTDYTYEWGSSETFHKYGYGGENEKSVSIRARNPYDGTLKKTELYFTIETLVEGNALIKTWDQNVVNAQNSIPDRIRIVQVE